MQFFKKGLLTLLVVTVGSALSRLATEIAGHGAWVFLALTAFLLILIWRKDREPIADRQEEIGENNRALAHSRNLGQPIIGENGFTQLMKCSAEGDREGCEKCLTDNASTINQVDDKGASALLYAVLNEHENVVEFLLRSGADTKIGKIQGKDVTSIAQIKNNNRIISLLSA